MDQREECGITWEPTVPGNPQMIGSPERLDQTIANYLRNRMPVTGRNITPMKAKQVFSLN